MINKSSDNKKPQKQNRNKRKLENIICGRNNKPEFKHLII